MNVGVLFMHLFHLYPAVFSHFQEYMVTSINMTAFYVTCTHFSIKHKKMFVCMCRNAYM